MKMYLFCKQNVVGIKIGKAIKYCKICIRFGKTAISVGMVNLTEKSRTKLEIEFGIEIIQQTLLFLTERKVIPFLSIKLEI
jgi:hypothetical protein